MEWPDHLDERGMSTLTKLLLCLCAAVLMFILPAILLGPSDVRSQTQIASPCPTVLKSVAFWAGSSFEGLSADTPAAVCEEQDPVNLALAGNHYVSLVYGDCVVDGDSESCLPPLEIQTAPTSERHYSLYTFNGEPYPCNTPSVSPPASKEVKLTGPPVGFDDGTIIELYLINGLTVSVMSEDPELVKRAVRAIRPMDPTILATAEVEGTEVGQATPISVAPLPASEAAATVCVI